MRQEVAPSLRLPGRVTTRRGFAHASPTSVYGSEPFILCLLGRRGWATTLKPSADLLGAWCPEPNAFYSGVEESVLLSRDSLCTCCPNVHAFRYSNRDTALCACCCSFQVLFSSCQGFSHHHHPFSIALFSSLTHLVLSSTRFSAVMVCWLFSR